ncbi:hypothetical protein, partial [Facklamia sp. P12950]|uniref:hypothetical protein n=1 Tax=Facklamia sp. P12950 TaxID=3421951 RepID=UPI003D172202
MEKAGSWGRNLQFQVNNLTKRIDLLEQSSRLSPEIERAIEADGNEYAAVNDALDAAVRAAEACEQRLSDIDLKATQLNAEVTTYRAAYSEVFDRLISGGAPESHPLVHTALVRSCCEVCNTADKRVSANVAAKLQMRKCPLCETELTSSVTPDPQLQKDLA